MNELVLEILKQGVKSGVRSAVNEIMDPGKAQEKEKEREERAMQLEALRIQQARLDQQAREFLQKARQAEIDSKKLDDGVDKVVGDLGKISEALIRIKEMKGFAPDSIKGAFDRAEENAQAEFGTEVSGRQIKEITTGLEAAESLVTLKEELAEAKAKIYFSKTYLENSEDELGQLALKDASLSPLVSQYLDEVRRALAEVRDAEKSMLKAERAHVMVERSVDEDSDAIAA